MSSQTVLFLLASSPPATFPESEKEHTVLLKFMSIVRSFAARLGSFSTVGEEASCVLILAVISKITT